MNVTGPGTEPSTSDSSVRRGTACAMRHSLSLCKNIVCVCVCFFLCVCERKKLFLPKISLGQVKKVYLNGSVHICGFLLFLPTPPK